MAPLNTSLNVHKSVVKNHPSSEQGCQIVYFKTKSPNSGVFWWALEWKMLVSIIYGHLVQYMAIWYNEWPLGVLCMKSFGIFFPFWYVCLDQETSGNPGLDKSFASLQRWQSSERFEFEKLF
jgi:hypothetical protein